MDTITFVDEFGTPRTVEVEVITKQDYDNFGGSEVSLFTEQSSNEYYEDLTERGNKMLKLNPGILYDTVENKSYIYNGDGVKLNISKKTEAKLKEMDYAEVVKFIYGKVNELKERAHSIHHGEEPKVQTKSKRKGLFDNLVGTTAIEEVKPEVETHENNKIRKQPKKPYSGIFGRFTNGDAPNVLKETVAAEHHQDFTSSLKYHIDPVTGVVQVLHTKTGTIDIADAGEIDSLYRNCPEFKRDYDQMLMNNVNRQVYTGNPIQDMMNGLGRVAY